MISPVQEHGGPESGRYAKTGATGDAQTRHEGAHGPGGADHQGHDPGAAAGAGRHGDGQRSIAESQQQSVERATSVAYQPGHRGHVEEHATDDRRRRRFVGQSVFWLWGQFPFRNSGVQSFAPVPRVKTLTYFKVFKLTKSERSKIFGLRDIFTRNRYQR